MAALRIEAEVDSQAKQACADVLRMIDECRRRRWIDTNRGAALTKNAGLLAADIFATGPEIIDMIDGHGSDDGRIRVDQIDCVEPSSKPHFQHQRGRTSACEQPQRRKRAELEVGQWRLLTHRFDGGERVA